MDYSEIKKMINNKTYISNNSFSLIKDIINFYNKDGNDKAKSQELILRALEKKECFHENAYILNDLIREIGLFPYLNPNELTLKDKFAYYTHLSPITATEKPIVFHREQAHIFYMIMSGLNVVLSAPTSFGKSLIIDAIISTKQFNNIVVIVPTIALIEETRRRLNKYKDYYNLITHTFQQKTERNIYVITQERCLDQGFIDKVDFFIIDEFYKLSITNEQNERADLLNAAFYILYKKCQRFYMLGPNIDGVTNDFKSNVEFHFVHLNYHTVATEFHEIYGNKSNEEKIKEIINNLTESSLFFCRSPKSVDELAKLLSSIIPKNDNKIITEFSQWLVDYYHKDWSLLKFLKHGIGIHHARIPRAIANFILYLFNRGILKYLICTSTLIEGVNTIAKNVIIYDNKISRKNIDYFTFNNIAGRSGRMCKHFVGNVYLLQPPPEPEFPLVDLPVFSQLDTVSDSLLLNIDISDLKESAFAKVQSIYENSVLSIDTIKNNIGIDPVAQINLAKAMIKNFKKWYPYLHWNRRPTWEQINFICCVIWEYFNGSKICNASIISSSKQLAYMIYNLKGLFKQSLDDYLSGCSFEVDKAIHNVLDFRKLWAGYHFPRLLNAINNIQNEIIKKQNLQPGDYRFYAQSIENFHFPVSMSALEEYGLPLEISIKLKDNIDFTDTFENILSQMQLLNISEYNISRIEKMIFSIFKDNI